MQTKNALVKPALDLTIKEVDPLALSMELLLNWANSSDPSVIQAFVKKRGVEECALLIQHIPTQKLQIVMDLDTWQRSESTRMEEFDLAQFTCWMKALLSVSSEHAVHVLCEMGIEHCAGIFAHFLKIIPMHVYAMNRAESGLAVEDKDVEHGDPLELGIFGDCYVKLIDFGKNSPHDELEDIFLDLLSSFQETTPEFLRGLFHHSYRMEEDEIVLDDFKWDRITRLNSQGYIPSFKALEILLRYRTAPGLRTEIRDARKQGWPADFWMAFLSQQKQVVSEGLVLQTDLNVSLISKFFEFVLAQESDLMSSVGFELSWISNLLVAGWQRGGEPIGPESGARGTKAIVELGLQSLLNYDSDKQHLQMDAPSFLGIADIFEFGWHSLYRRVALPCARALDKRLQDRNIQNSLVREAWYGACKRRKMDNYGMEYWVRQGRYQLIRNVLNELEYALGAEATYYARTLLDDLPRFPEAKPNGSFKPRTRYFVKITDFESALSLFRKALEL